MGAKLNYLPSSIVYDRSFLGSISYTWTATNPNLINYIVQNGNYNDLVDKNLDTFWEVYTYQTSYKQTFSTIIDYGKIFWNCIVNMKIQTTSNIEHYTALIQTSTDGVNWEDVETCPSGTTKTLAFNSLALRYVRIYNQDYTGTNNEATSTRIYEMRLMGSD